LDAASWGFIGTLIGAIVGASASVLTTSINSRNAVQLHKANNDLDRAERARAFQRETLLGTQEVLQASMRLMARAHIADTEAFRLTGQWGRNMLGDDLNESILLANQKMTALVERISDDSLRNTLKDLHGEISSVSQSDSRDEANIAFYQVGPAFQDAMTQLGTALRTFY
jgi:hypothetical protein